MVEFAKRFTMIAPDVAGFGDSAIPADRLDMKTAAIRMHAFAKRLHVTNARVWSAMTSASWSHTRTPGSFRQSSRNSS